MHQQTQVAKFSHIIYGNLQLLLKDGGFPVRILAFYRYDKKYVCPFLVGVDDQVIKSGCQGLLLSAPIKVKTCHCGSPCSLDCRAWNNRTGSN